MSSIFFRFIEYAVIARRFQVFRVLENCWRKNSPKSNYSGFAMTRKIRSNTRFFSSMTAIKRFQRIFKWQHGEIYSEKAPRLFKKVNSSILPLHSRKHLQIYFWVKMYWKQPLGTTETSVLHILICPIKTTDLLHANSTYDGATGTLPRKM